MLWISSPIVYVEVQQKVLNAEGKDVLRDVAFELNDLNDGKTEVGAVGWLWIDWETGGSHWT